MELYVFHTLFPLCYIYSLFTYIQSTMQYILYVMRELMQWGWVGWESSSEKLALSSTYSCGVVHLWVGGLGSPWRQYPSQRYQHSRGAAGVEHCNREEPQGEGLCVSLCILLPGIPRNNWMRLLEAGGLMSCCGRHWGKAHMLIRFEETWITCNENFPVFCLGRLSTFFKQKYP